MRTNNQSRLASSKATFEAALIIPPDAVFSITKRTTSFEPPYVSKTLPIGQRDRDMSFIITITRSPTLKLRDFEFHFRRIVKMGKYSCTHLLQNISVAVWTDLHFLLELNSCSLKLPGLWFGDASPMSKCLDLMDRSQIYHHRSRLWDVHLKLIPLRKEMFGGFSP